MKKLSIVLALAMIATALCGCSGGKEPTAAPKALEESAQMAAQVAEKLEQSVPVDNPRAIDDFSVENEMGLKLADLQAYAGHVTNTQSDCALVFVALCKEGTVNTVKDSLEAYRVSMTSNLYLEFAAKVKQAEEARIVTSGNYVIMVMAGVEGPEYSVVDQAISDALKG